MNRVRLSFRVGIALLVIAALFVLARFLGGFFIWYLFDFLTILLLLESILGLMLFRGATVSRSVAGRASRDGVVRVSEDDNVAVEVTLRKPGWLPLSWCRVTDVLPNRWSFYSEMATHIVPLTWAKTVKMSYRVRHVKRGVYTLSSIQLTAGDWFGLFGRHKRFAVNSKIIVHPDPLPVMGWRSMMGLAGEASRSASNRIDDGNQPFSVRPHVTGDAMHRIHWRSTAHHGKLMTRLGESYAAEGLSFLLDLTGTGAITDLGLEWRVRVLASLLAEAHRQGQPWELRLYPVHIHKAAPGDHESWQRAMDALAAVRGTSSGDVLQEIGRFTTAMSQSGMIVLVTRYPDAPLLEAVSRLARRSHVLWCIAEPARTESHLGDVTDFAQPLQALVVSGARIKFISRAEDLTFDAHSYVSRR